MNVMRLAAEELNAENLVTVIDSANLSTGIGLLVIEAAEMAQQGKSAAEITTRIEELKPLVRASFVDGAEVFGVVLCSSDQSKISCGVIFTPSRYSSSPNKI